MNLLAILTAATITAPTLSPSNLLVRDTNPVGRTISLLADKDPGVIKGPTELIWLHRQPLDQKQTGGCVEFGLGNYLNAQPQKRFQITNPQALDFYQRARAASGFPALDSYGTYPVTAFKILKNEGKLSNIGPTFFYEREIRKAIFSGPVCLSIPWYLSFNAPIDGSNGRGRLQLYGPQVGGHFITVIGINQKLKVYILLQTWPSYPPYQKYNQVVEVPFATVRKLMNRGGYGYQPVKVLK
jgi:hypothetical protein